jgi:hypothetical protein
MFSVFLKQQSRNRGGEEFDAGKLLFFLRNLMIRHTQKQTYRGTTTTLMSLPAKVSQSAIASVIAIKYIVDLTPFLSIPFFRRKERSKSLSRIRSRLSTTRLNKVRKLFIRRSRHSMGRRSVAITSRFLRSLLQCESPAPEESTPSMRLMTRKKRKTAPVLYSDFAFTSKFKTLLKELENIRDKDPTCKHHVSVRFPFGRHRVLNLR